MKLSRNNKIRSNLNVKYIKLFTNVVSFRTLLNKLYRIDHNKIITIVSKEHIYKLIYVITIMMNSFF